jgi:curli production assembly/transport component CsgE
MERFISRANLTAIFGQAVLIICLLMILSTIASAQGVNGNGKDLKVDGILIDRTMTPIGQHFFQAFSSHWASPEGVSFESIMITEIFNPQWGSMIFITIDNQDAFERLMLNRNKDMDELGRSVADEVAQYLMRREIIRRYQQSNDLYGDGY